MKEVTLSFFILIAFSARSTSTKITKSRFDPLAPTDSTKLNKILVAAFYQG
jgi:hypothetical protein